MILFGILRGGSVKGFPKAQGGPKALSSTVFGPNSLKICVLRALGFKGAVKPYKPLNPKALSPQTPKPSTQSP